MEAGIPGSDPRILRELEEYRLALDASAIVALTDRDGVILHVNQRFCDVTGYSADELIGGTHRMVSSGHHDPAFFEDLWETILAGQIWRGRIRNRHREGDHYWVDTTITPLLGPDGEPHQFLAVRHDVTELVQTTQALSTSRGRLRAILDNAAVGIAVVDLDDRFVEVGAALLQMLRCTEGALEERIFTDFRHPDDEQAAADRAMFEQLVAGERESYEIDRRYLRCDGTSFVGHTTVSLIRDAEGQPDSVIGVIQDVTEARELERRLREQRTLARMGEMSAILAHEIRNPLAGIRSAVEIVGREFEPDTPAAAAVTSVRERIASLDELLTQLLTFARPAEPRRRRVSIRSILERVRQHVGVDRLELVGDPPDVVLRGDAGMLEGAFTNLAMNGVQASRGAPVRVSLAADDASVTIDFVDDGPGIPAAQAEQVFEPFFTTKSRGAGLGLAITRRAVEAHRGTVTVADAASGACMRVSLPRIEPD